jgi:hypothetical protein
VGVFHEPAAYVAVAVANVDRLGSFSQRWFFLIYCGNGKLLLLIAASDSHAWLSLIMVR